MLPITRNNLLKNWLIMQLISIERKVPVLSYAIYKKAMESKSCSGNLSDNIFYNILILILNAKSSCLLKL